MLAPQSGAAQWGRPTSHARIYRCPMTRNPSRKASKAASTNWKRSSRNSKPATCTLERSLELFEKGMTLSESCRKQLEEAETRVEMLIRKDGKLQPEPFRPDKGMSLREYLAAAAAARGLRTRPPGPRRNGPARNHPPGHALQPVRRRKTHPPDALPGGRAARSPSTRTASVTPPARSN